VNIQYIMCHTYSVGERASSDVLPAGARPSLWSASFHRVVRSSSRPVWAHLADDEHMSRLPVQTERRRHGQTVETTLVRVRPCRALPALLLRQDREASWRRLHLVPDDPGRVRRPRATVTQPAPRVHVLRQDGRTSAVSHRAVARDDANMDRRDLHRRRGIPTVLRRTSHFDIASFPLGYYRARQRSAGAAYCFSGCCPCVCMCPQKNWK